MKIKIFFEKILDAIFVKDVKCLICEKELNEDNILCLCEECYSKLPYILNSCEICGTMIKDGFSYCPNCYKGKFHFNKVYSVFDYSGKVKELIHNFKFYNKKYIGEYFSKVLFDYFIKKDIKCDLIMPVPLHINDLKSRKFNQSEVLLKEFVNKGFNIRTDILKKVKLTDKQHNLNFNDRKTNLINAFEINNEQEIKGKTILLIDDIITTGSTIDECSKILKQFKAKKVIALTVANTHLESA